MKKQIEKGQLNIFGKKGEPVTGGGINLTNPGALVEHGKVTGKKTIKKGEKKRWQSCKNRGGQFQKKAGGEGKWDWKKKNEKPQTSGGLVFLKKTLAGWKWGEMESLNQIVTSKKSKKEKKQDGSLELEPQVETVTPAKK